LVAIRVWVVLGEGCLFRPGGVTGVLRESAELGDRNRMLVDPERADRDLSHRPFLG
jgi:hypothetical protein